MKKEIFVDFPSSVVGVIEKLKGMGYKNLDPETDASNIQTGDSEFGKRVVDMAFVDLDYADPEDSRPPANFLDPKEVVEWYKNNNLIASPAACVSIALKKGDGRFLCVWADAEGYWQFVVEAGAAKEFYLERALFVVRQGLLCGVKSQTASTILNERMMKAVVAVLPEKVYVLAHFGEMSGSTMDFAKAGPIIPEIQVCGSEEEALRLIPGLEKMKTRRIDPDTLQISECEPDRVHQSTVWVTDEMEHWLVRLSTPLEICRMFRLHGGSEEFKW